jgi:hypothetical protein
MTVLAMLQFQISATVPYTGKRNNRIWRGLSTGWGIVVDA